MSPGRSPLIEEFARRLLRMWGVERTSGRFIRLGGRDDHAACSEGPVGIALDAPDEGSASPRPVARADEVVAELSADQLASSIILATMTGVEQFDALILEGLRRVLPVCPLAVVALPADEPPARPLQAWLTQAGLPPEISGSCVDSGPRGSHRWSVSLLHGGGTPSWSVPPDDFKVLAVMPVYNEEDVIRPVVDRLLGEGLSVHVIDNWSNDGTVEELKRLDAGRALSVERWPAPGPTGLYDLTGLCRRMEEVASSTDASWIVCHDADELRQSPWPGRSLPEALWMVDRWGFNAVDHTLVNFKPVDDDFVSGTDFTQHLRHFRFEESAIRSPQLRTWKIGPKCDLVSSAGHEARFPGRRVFPLNFLLRHYPIRGQRHGEKKVYRDRKPRYPGEELAKGWHNHYRRGQRRSFLARPKDLVCFDEVGFAEEFLLPRLARLGVPYPPETLAVRFKRVLLGQARRAGLLPTYARLKARFHRLTNP